MASSANTIQQDYPIEYKWQALAAQLSNINQSNVNDKF